MALKIGDIVYLQASEIGPSTWLCAEGHLSDEVFVTQNETLFSNCLWEIYTQCQYSADMEWREAQETIEAIEAGEEGYEVDKKSLPALLDKLVQVRRAAESEILLNKKVMQLKLGKLVTFGDVIQLRHLKSKRVMTVSSWQLAKQEKENMRIQADDVGDSLSFLSIIPKSKSDREGGAIKTGSECFIRIHEKSGEYLRAVKKFGQLATEGAKEGKLERMEVNCSPELTAWTLHIFHSHVDPREKIIFSQSLITLGDPEAGTCITVNNAEPGPTGEIDSARVVTMQLAGRNPEYATSYIGTDMLWLVEKEDVTEGGVVYLKTTRVVLVHYNSGLYLKMEFDGTISAVRDRHFASLVEFHSAEGDDSGTVFLDGSHISLCISGTRFAVCTNDTNFPNPDGTLSTLCETTNDMKTALRLSTSLHVSRRIDSDLHFGVAAVNKMRSFVAFTETKMAAGMQPAPDVFASATAQVRLILTIVDGLCVFLGERREEEEGREKRSALMKLLDEPIRGKVDSVQQALRQCILREQGLIDVMLDILVLCAKGRFDQVKLNLTVNAGESGKNISPAKTTKPTLMRKSSSVRGMMISPEKDREDESTRVPKKRGGGPGSLIRTGTTGETSSSIANLLGERKGSASDASGGGSGSSAKSLGRSESRRSFEGHGSINSRVGAGGSSGGYSKSPSISMGQKAPSFGGMMNAIGTSFRYAAASTSNKKFKVGADNYDSDLSESDAGSDNGRGDDSDDDDGPNVALTKLGNSAATDRVIRKQSTAALLVFQGGNSRSSQASADNADTRRATVSEELAQALLRVVYMTAMGNHFNQLHVSQRLSVILSLVTSQVLAVKCMRELLRDNLKILQSTVHQADIDTMVENIRQHELNTTFLRLLQSTCSCPKGVDSTQRMVVLALYGERVTETGDSIVMTMYVDDSRPTPMDWTRTSGSSYHYIPIASDANFLQISGRIMGGHLIKHGMPQVLVRWAQGTGPGKDVRIAMSRLFSTDNAVAIDVLSEFAARSLSAADILPMGETRKTSSFKRASSVMHSRGLSGSKGQKRSITNITRAAPKMASTVELKCRVADYLIAQLYLVADLCLDRNYVSIRILEKIYSYDLLISILKRDDLSNAIKAPTCRILRTLWVDREPQVAKIFPSLIRTQSAASSHRGTEDDMRAAVKAKPATGKVAATASSPDESKDAGGFSVHTFVILQQIISDYLWLQLNSDKRDEYSYEILELLQSLMKFGFYSSDSNQLQDVVVPIIRAMGAIKQIKAAPDADSEGEKEESKGGADDNDRGGAMQEIDGASWWVRGLRRARVHVVAAIVNFSHASMKEGWTARAEHRQAEYEASLKNRRNAKRKPQGDFGAEQFWEQHVINFLESIFGMVASLTIVLIVCAVSVSNVSAEPENTPYSLQTFYDNFDIFVSVFFSVELVIRIYCHLVIYPNPFFFFQNSFNVLDFSLVAMDLILVGLGTGQNSLVGTARLSRIARVLRLLRLLRIFRALRLLKQIADASRLAVVWIMPERFTSLSELDVKTLTSMLGIMSFVYKHIQDQQLDVVVEAFDEWSDLMSVGEPADAVEIYKRYVARYDKAQHEIPPEFDNIVLDILMYSDSVITREALQLLMTHKNSKQILFEVLEDVHLVYSRPVESKLVVLRQTIHDLQRLTEMYEIWQDMDSEEHEETAEDMLSAAQTLQRLMVRSNEDKSLESTTELLPDPECQKLVRNLRVLDTTMSAFETLFDGGREDLHPKVTKILCALSAFLVDFLRDNERNQLEAFAHLAWFIETIDHKFDSHLVVRAILVGNYRLINECTRSYISFFAQKILTAGRKSEYLQLFLGLCEKSYLDKTFVAPPSVISEITRVLIGKEWKHHILLWICEPGSAAYAKRSAALDEYNFQEQLPLDCELSPDLQYHVAILKILAACRIGPKLQAIYPLDHIIHAMLDRNCLSQVRIPLGELLLQLFESGIDNVEMAEYVWRFMDFVILFLQDAMGELTAITQMPQNEYSCFMRTRMRDWVLVMLSILVVFFSDLDMTTFGELSDGDIGMLVTTRTDLDVQKVIKSLYVNIRQFMEFHALLLGNEIIESCGVALLALCTHSNALDYDYSEVLAAKTVFKRSQPRVMRGSNGARLHGEDATQQQVKNNFNNFVDMIRDYERQSMQDQSVALFVKIPLLNDKRHSDVRFEVLLKKFCGYVQSLLRNGELNGQKSNASNQAVWVVQLMRRLLEKEYEAVDVHNADHHEGSVGASSTHNFVETARSIELRTAFMNEGLVQLCVDCCASTTNLELVVEAMLLLTVILSRTSAKAEVQRHLHDYLFNNETSFFFKCIDGMLKEISYWCKSEYEAQSADATPLSEIVVVLPDNAIVLRLLLLLCDGDYHPLKDMIRTQEKNAEQVNIIARLASMADVFSRHESPTLTNVCLLVFKALRNIIYGLNAGNQEYLVLQTEVLSSMNRLMRSSRARTAAMSSQWYDDVERLKECVLDVLTCAVEGHSPNSSVFDRIINSIELNVLSAVLMPALASPTDSITDMELTPIESKYLELLETLGKSSETLTDLGAHKAKENISFVEVVRGTEVHKVYFQKPSVVELLSEDFILDLMERLDCSSQEVKLNDFMREIKSQYIETQYQSLLKPFGLNYAWAWRERIEWLMFINAVVVNCLLLEYLDKRAGFTVAVSDVDSVLQAQLSVQIALAALLTFLFFFIRLPAKFMSGLENGMTQWTALIATISDVTFIWRFVYLVLTVLAISFSYIFATALLLDWVALDATTRQVLKAVQYPIRQLVATFIIIVIVLNIFAGAYFMLFIDECEFELDSLFDAWKLALSYGLRGEYGMGHEFVHSIGERLVLDVAFYFIVLAILRNSFMAIIVDTFGASTHSPYIYFSLTLPFSLSLTTHLFPPSHIYFPSYIFPRQHFSFLLQASYARCSSRGIRRPTIRASSAAWTGTTTTHAPHQARPPPSSITARRFTTWRDTSTLC